MRIRSVLLAALVLAAAAHAQPAWVTRSAAPTAREDAAVVALGDGKVLLAGGKGAAGAALATVELYDPLTDRFTSAPSLPMPEGRPVGALLRDGAVLLLRDGVPATWLWRPGDAAWSAGPMLPAAVAAPLLARLSDGALLLASASGAMATWVLSDGAWKAGPPLARPNAEALLTSSDGAAVAIVRHPWRAGTDGAAPGARRRRLRGRGGGDSRAGAQSRSR